MIRLKRAALLIGIGWLTAGGLMAAPLKPAVTTLTHAPDRILVRYRDTLSTADVDRMAQRRALQVRAYMPGSGVAVIQVPPGDTAEALVERLKVEESSTVVDARLDYIWPAISTPNDPFLGDEYYISKCNVPAAWDTTTGGGVTIAIADTGVDVSHPDLTAHLLSGTNFGDGNSNVQDFYGHGTAVAGTAAAVGNNGIGVAGMAYNASILPIKISAGTTGNASDSAIIAAIEYAADHGAKIVNVSFGSPVCGVCAPDDWLGAAAYMRNKGGLVTAAAGNGDSLGNPCQLTCSPHPGMVIVAATDSSDHAASFTNYGTAIDVSAPGVMIATTWCPSCSDIGGGSYGYVDGTSFAAPATAGVLGLIYAIDSNFTSDQAAQILFDSADDVGLGPNYGHGRIDAGKAIALAATRSITFQRDNLTNVYAYPNPWDIRNPNYSSQKRVTIANLPDNAPVKIFTLSGFWIKTLTPQNGQAIWDLTNDSGQDVASGVYLYVITGNGNKVRGKIALIR